MPSPNAVNPITGKRYAWEEEQRRLAGKDPELDRINAEAAMFERQLTAVKARDDLLAYTKFTMPDPEAPSDVHRSRYKAAQFHEIIARHLEEVEAGDVRQLIFCMPPRHGKTEMATKRLAAWYSGRHPDHNVAVGSYSDTMAEDMGADTRAILATAQHKQVFPAYRLRRGGNAKANIQTQEGGRLVFVGRGGALTGRGAHCFVAGTSVTTADGSIPIEDVLTGQKVLTHGENGFEYRPVQAVARRQGSRIFRITTAAGRVVEATGDHPFYVDGRWVQASELASGDRLLCAVRDTGRSASLRGEEAFPARPRPVLLLNRVLGRASEPRAPWRSALLPLRGTRTAPEFMRLCKARALLLLGGLQGRRTAGGVGATGAGANASVRTLQRNVHAGQFRDALLRLGVFVSGSRGADARRGQPALEGWHVGEPGEAARYQAVPRASANGDEAGRATLRALRGDDAAGGASHRRECAEQPGVEPRDAVPALSRAGAFFRREGDVVVSVEDTGRGADVYDIQVEGTHCFFAKDILVHNCLIIDDLYKDHEEARSQAVRDAAWNWFTKVAMTRRMGKKLVIITMTRWHSDDVIGRITDPDNPHFNAIEAKKWKIIRLPAIAEEDDPLGREEGQPLWPDGPDEFDLDFLQSQQRLDPMGFASLYQQRPTVADGILFRRENIQRYHPSELPDDLRFYCTSDHAVGTKQRNDPSCFGKAGVDKQDNIWLTDLFWKRVPTDQAVEAMLAMGGGNQKPLLWWAERGHISKSIGPFLRKRMMETGTYINIVEVTPTADKETRAQSIAARVALGKVYIPHGPIWDKAIDEMLGFPNALHDDFVDMLSLFGLGLQSQHGPKEQTKRTEPAKFGTLAWVKEHDRWAEYKKRAAAQGGF